MRTLLFALIASSLLGCREDCKNELGVAEITIDPSFSSSEQDSLFRASQRWNEFAGRTVIRITGRERKNVCTVINSPDLEVGPNMQGVHRWESGNMEIARLLSCNGEPLNREPLCFEAIVMHEMGHLLGMKHGATGIMRGSGGAALSFDSADWNQCVVIDVCK